MAAQIGLYYTGGVANANPDLSLGGDLSSVALLTPALNNLFDNVLPTDLDLSLEHWRCNCPARASIFHRHTKYRECPCRRF
jgi:hypothetical protein